MHRDGIRVSLLENPGPWPPSRKIACPLPVQGTTKPLRLTADTSQVYTIQGFKDMPAHSETNTPILVASRNSDLTDRISSVLNEAFAVTVYTHVDETPEHLDALKPQLLMLDPGLFKDKIQDTISNTLSRHPQVRVIILVDEQNNPVDQLALFKSGVHGFLAHTISSELLFKAAHAVCSGEVWVPRQLIASLVGELARDTSAGTYTLKFAGNHSIEHLTPRELQVAEMVHLGGNNKTIARKLDISERTVKAHLSAIFRKLDIENRLHLALYFSQLR
jgi:DNA-binding NarL/FixJ family response regulator